MLIIWSWVPCDFTGAGILMRRLFAGYPSDRLWALTTRSSKRIAGSYDPVPPPERQATIPEILIHRRWLDKLALLLNRLLIPWCVWRGVRLVREEEIEAIFTVPWDHLTISAYFVHKITGRPLYMYVMDDPAGARRFGGFQPILYALLMPRIVRACRRVWGVSEGMCEYFEQAYQVRCLPLLPLINVADFQRNARNANRADDSFRIVFTGSIYSAQLDALRRLVRVVNQETTRRGGAHPGIQLTLYTPLPDTALERMGLSGPNIRRDEVEQENIATVMAAADVAFLPLSFEPGMRHIVETSFPSKTAEYLAAGVPVLVHAPSYAAVTRYCRKHGCGLVVDQPDEVALRDALLQLESDTALRQRLVANALEVAGKYHDAGSIASAFLDQINYRFEQRSAPLSERF